VRTDLIAPLREDVLVRLGVDPTALEIIEGVVGALEGAGHDATADAFLSSASHCDTDADVLLLARCTVTIL
jgi:hypothetical protein